jgi:hypothetical protein
VFKIQKVLNTRTPCNYRITTEVAGISQALITFAATLGKHRCYPENSKIGGTLNGNFDNR